MKKVVLMALILSAFFALFGEKQKFTVLRLDKPLKIEGAADFILKDLPPILSIKGDSFKGVLKNSNLILKNKIYRVAWEYKGIPVVGKFTILKERDGAIFKILNSIDNFSIDTEPKISPEKAVMNLIGATNLKNIQLPDFIHEKVIIEHLGKYRLAYKIRFRPANLLDGRFYFVDAETGRLLRSGNFVKSAENSAKVFKTNPVRNKTAEEVELLWVADDAGGTLTAETDENGIRKIVTANCPDKGETFEYYEQRYPICTITQLANKNENGNFIYEDWNNGVEYSFDSEDIYPEVALYYHMTKIYNYLLELGLKDFTQLGNHKNGNPITGVANFQMFSYDDASQPKLAPFDNAFYTPHDPYFAEMFFKNFAYDGDFVVLGQGSKADFAYDGDVVYHEFGHAVVEGTAQLNFSGNPDLYGYSNETIGVDEGMADTFSFLITEDRCLGEYVSEAYGQEGERVDGFFCLRNADNENLVNEDFIGESHNDGLPTVSAHWKLYQKVLEAGFTKDDFARFFMTSLLSIPSSDLNYQEWGRVLLETVGETNLADLKADFEQILTEKGFFNEIRARDIMREAPYFYFGGKALAQGYPSTNTVYAEIEGEKTEVSPMYFQLYYDVPERVDTVTLSGMPYGENGRNYAPKFNLLVRKKKPIVWDNEEYPSVVKYDEYVFGSNHSWTVSNLESGNRYYFQFINLGYPGFFYAPKAEASWSSTEEPVVSDSDEDELPDSDSSGDGGGFNDSDSGGDGGGGSGCSAIIF